MVAADFLSQLKEDIQRRYQQKYGPVSINFDALIPEGERTARVQFTISDRTGFITRYYGLAHYNEDTLHLDISSI